MGLLDKARDFVEQHDETVDRALDKAGEQVDQHTDGKYSDQIKKAVDAAQEHTGPGDTSP